MQVNIHDSWKSQLAGEFDKPYFQRLAEHLKTEIRQGKTVYPPGGLIFHAFTRTPFDRVRVVLLGQDPYHGQGQAQGLCFSVGHGIKPPPSLVNIGKELLQDVGVRVPAGCGDLSTWADQGVLLLNTTLTVRAGEPLSHSQLGWTAFTDAVIRCVSEHRDHVVFLLWGKHAQSKEALIDSERHRVLKAAHPSPFSADKGFFGSRPFSQTNEYLRQHGEMPIDWSFRCG